MSFTELKAPVDGIISRVNVDQFENIQVGQYIVNIHSVDRVEVLIQLPDRLHVNQSPKEELLSSINAVVRVPSGNEYRARVTEFTTQPDPNTGTFTATLSLPMPKSEYIFDGMAVDVTSKIRKQASASISALAHQLRRSSMLMAMISVVKTSLFGS